MAQISEYEVLHPVRHNGNAHPRGATLRLTSSEGSRLVALQVARPKAGSTPIEVTDETVVDRTAFIDGIDKATKAQLIQFAKASYNLDLAGSKDELVAAILNAEAATGL